jgi:hypothetical protein
MRAVNFRPSRSRVSTTSPPTHTQPGEQIEHRRASSAVPVTLSGLDLGVLGEGLNNPLPRRVGRLVSGARRAGIGRLPCPGSMPSGSWLLPPFSAVRGTGRKSVTWVILIEAAQILAADRLTHRIFDEPVRACGQRRQRGQAGCGCHRVDVIKRVLRTPCTRGALPIASDMRPAA